MNIGIDIDGVLLDTENYFRVMADINDIENFGNQGVINPNELKIEDRMNWSRETFEKFIDDYMYTAMERAPLMVGVKGILPRLRALGHRLIVITARGKYTEKEVEIAQTVFKREGLEFDDIKFRSMNKLPVCLDEKIDYMIDDMYSNVMQLSDGGVKCLYFRGVGRKKIDRQNVTEVHTWGDVYRFFANFEKNK